MPYISVYGFGLFTMPGALSASNISNDTLPNAPGATHYSASSHSWVGHNYTFNGGAPTALSISDDDALFQDGYVETGGAQTLTQAVTIGGVTYPAGSVIENEFSLIDAAGHEVWVIRIAGQNVGFAFVSGDAPTAGEVFHPVTGLDGSPADNPGGTGTSSVNYRAVLCFLAGTLIATPRGNRLVERIRPGDMVMTADGPAPVRWAGRMRAVFRCGQPGPRPVRFAAGSLGPGQPQRPLTVSPQHRMLAGGDVVRRLFFTDEVLAPARGLLGLAGAKEMRGGFAAYRHLLLDRHAILFAEGAATESLYGGAAGLPATMAPCTDPRPARRLLTRREAERLVDALKAEGAHLAPAWPAARRPARQLVASGN